MWNAKKFSAKTPPMLIGIVLGCALYYLCLALGFGAYLGPVIANQERAVMGLTAFPYFSDLKHSGDLLEFRADHSRRRTGARHDRLDRRASVHQAGHGVG